VEPEGSLPRSEQTDIWTRSLENLIQYTPSCPCFFEIHFGIIVRLRRGLPSGFCSSRFPAKILLASFFPYVCFHSFII
jgi:hypothetical protein